MVLALAFVSALAVTPIAIAVARRARLLDRPGHLKLQTEAVPYLGGVGVAAGLGVGVVPARVELVAPLALALALGVVDDARDISARVRLTVEVLVGAIAAALLPPARLPAAAGVVAVVVLLLVLVNGVNMLDGLDALAGGVAVMSALGFALVMGSEVRSVALGLAGGLLGFLVFNRPPAKVYLGDGGAYLIGAALAVLVALTWSEDPAPAVSVGCLLFVACPVGELGLAVVRRVRSGAGLFAGDRGHIYDQLVDRGWSRTRAATAYILAQALFTAAGVGAAHLPTEAAWAVAGVSGLAVVSILAALGFLTSTPRETAA